MSEVVKTILIIEDNYELWQSILERLFPKEEGYHIIFNKGDSDIFETLKTNNLSLSDIDLIISDYFLKNKNGVQWISDNVKNIDSQLPVIFWTASMDVNIIKETILGQYVFFKKDLNLAKFKQTAHDLISQRITNKDYPLFNVCFNNWVKPRDKNYRKLCYVAYTNASRFLEGFFGHSKFHSVFNTHGLIHAQNVVNNLAKLMLLAPDYFKDNEETQDNYFVLGYLAALFHDLGMIPQKYDDKVEFVDFKKTRKNHAKKTAYLILSGKLEKMLDLNFDEYISGNANDFRNKLGFICLYHDCHYQFKDFVNEELIDELKKWEASEGYSNSIFSNEADWEEIILSINKNAVKLRTLAALVALADKLDYNISRVPVGPVRESPLRSMRDEFEYLKNECVENYKLSNTHNGPVLTLHIKQPDIGKSRLNYNGDELFDEFVQSINENDGNIKDYPVYLASIDLVEGVLKKKWVNIQEALELCDHDYLKKLQVSFKYNNTSYIDLSTPINIHKKNDSEIEYIGARNINDFEKSLFNSIFKDKFCGLKVMQIVEGYSSEKVFLISNIKQKILNDIHYETQKKLVKIGDYDNIHREFQNYYNIALPFIAPKSIMGFAEEFKYLDKGAIVGSIITTEEGEIKNMHEVLLNEKNNLISNISKSLGIFFQKISPITDQTINVIEKYEYLFHDKYLKILKTNESHKNTITEIYSNIIELFKEIPGKKMNLTLSYVHGDFTFRNILQAGTGNDELVFIDFADSCVGHFFIDFAKLDHYIRHELLDYSYKALPSGRLVEFENALLKRQADFEKNDSYFDKAESVSKEIYSVAKKMIDGSQIQNQIDFEFEFNLAKLYVNFWSLSYSKDFDLSIESRLEIVKLFVDYLANRIYNLDK